MTTAGSAPIRRRSCPRRNDYRASSGKSSSRNSAASRLPAAARAQAAVEPIYETIAGWSGSTKGARSYADLPAQAVKYVRRIEELVEAPVTLLSTSPDRDDTILVRDPFES